MSEQEPSELPRWARSMTRWLDDAVRVPGTRFGVGLDAVIGALMPGAGDAVTGVGAAALLVLALRERVPSVVVARMVFNLLVDVLVGAIPLLGDLFDVFWRSNRKNLDLIERHRGGKEQPSAWDYVLVCVGLTLCLLMVMMPIIWIVLFGSLTKAWLGAGSSG